MSFIIWAIIGVVVVLFCIGALQGDEQPAKKAGKTTKSKTNSFPKKTVSKSTDAGPFAPIVEVSDAFSYLKVEFKNNSIQLGLKTATVQESKWALEEVDLLKKTAQHLKKEYKMKMTEFRQSFQNEVANRGAMIPGGGKFGTFARFAVRASRAGQRGSASQGLLDFQKAVVDPIDGVLMACDKMKLTLKKEIIAG
jgi:hypothetical protein